MSTNTQPHPFHRDRMALRWIAAAAVVIVVAVLLRVLTSGSPADAEPAATADSSTTAPAPMSVPDRTADVEAAPTTTAAWSGEEDRTLEACEVGDEPAGPLKAAMEDLFGDGTLDCDPFPAGDDSEDTTSTEIEPSNAALDLDAPAGWTLEQVDEDSNGYLSPDGSAAVYGAAAIQNGATLEDWVAWQLSGLTDYVDEVKALDVNEDRFLDHTAMRADVEYTLSGKLVVEEVYMFEHGDHFVIVGIVLASDGPDADESRLAELRTVIETVKLPS